MASVLEALPDIAIFHVLNYVSTEDLINLSECSEGLKFVCSDHSVVRKTSFEGQYSLKDDEFRDYMNNHGSRIEHLNLNHCYWISARSMISGIPKCTRLRSLHLLECKINKVANLVSLIERLPHLTSLAFSVQSFNDLKKDVFNSCRDVLHNLQTIHLYYSSRELSVMHYLGEHTTILDHCDNLEHINIGSAGMAIPELYRPLVSKAERFAHLKSMSITSNIHAGAQMLYYGTLSQLPNERIKFQSLLMPNVNFPEFMRKPDFKACLTHLQHLKHLDIYGSKMLFPDDFINSLERASELEFLNLGASLVTGEQLTYVASHCHKLTAVNLVNCTNILSQSALGLEALFRECKGLRRLNISGEHHHVHASRVSSESRDTSGSILQRVSHCLSGLTSLSLPACMLVVGGSQERRKRALPSKGSPASPPAKRVCRGANTPGEEIAIPSTSNSVTHRRHATDRSKDFTSTEKDTNDQLTFLERIVQQNPDLQELEIITPDLCSAIHQNRFIKPKTLKPFEPCVETRQVSDATLEPISQLKVLHSLTLMGLPGVNTGRSLLSITTSCQELTSLNIGFLGTALSSGHFYQALGQLIQLQDLRIEQPHLQLRAQLFEALSRCCQLQRLCIIAKNSNFNGAHVTNMVHQCTRLVALQLFAGGTTSNCTSLKASLKSKYMKSRPALQIAIHPLLHDRLPQILGAANTAIPAIHCEQLTRFHSRVATSPEVH